MLLNLILQHFICLCWKPGTLIDSLAVIWWCKLTSQVRLQSAGSQSRHVSSLSRDVFSSDSGSLPTLYWTVCCLFLFENTQFDREFYTTCASPYIEFFPSLASGRLNQPMASRDTWLWQRALTLLLSFQKWKFIFMRQRKYRHCLWDTIIFFQKI